MLPTPLFQYIVWSAIAHGRRIAFLKARLIQYALLLYFYIKFMTLDSESECVPFQERIVTVFKLICRYYAWK